MNGMRGFKLHADRVAQMPRVQGSWTKYRNLLTSRLANLYYFLDDGWTKEKLNPGYAVLPDKVGNFGILEVWFSFECLCISGFFTH